jgi:hypothetical protein
MHSCKNILSQNVCLVYEFQSVDGGFNSVESHIVDLAQRKRGVVLPLPGKLSSCDPIFAAFIQPDIQRRRFESAYAARKGVSIFILR